MTDNSYYLKALIENKADIVKAIYTANFFKVRAFVVKNNGQIQDAEDIFQKALLQLAVRYKKEKFVINTSFEAYLYTVCKNLWRRELNKSKLQVTNSHLIEPKDDNEDIALAVMEQKRWELFTECLEKISDNCRKVLKLFFAKTPYSKMVEIFDYNSETVARQRVFKCKNKLKELVRGDHRFSTLIEL